MKRGPTFNVRTWLQVVLLPALALITVATGLRLIVELRREIMSSFDQMLFGVSAVAAAFIDPTEHAWLMETRRWRDLAYDGTADVIYGWEDGPDGPRGVRLAAQDGRELAMVAGPGATVRSLGFDPGRGRLLAALEGHDGWVEIDPETGVTTSTGGPDEPVMALSDGDAQGTWWLATRTELRWVDGASGAVLATRAGDFSAVTALVRGEAANHVWFHEAATAQWWEWTAGSAVEPRRVDWPEGETVPTNAVWDQRRRRWVTADTQLREISLVDRTGLETEFAAAFGREESPIYARAVGPLREIRDRLGLTYFYTQTVTDGDRIAYGLDGTTGENHSPLLTPDALPADEVPGIARLLEEGQPHFTRVRRWEHWGLLKSAFAPIFDEAGRVVAMVGADVDVSIIETQTRRALLSVFVIGLTTLMVSSAWSLRIARDLRRPVEELKRGALRMAAGDFSAIEVARPREVRDLAQSFNAAGGEMVRAAEQLERTAQEQSRARDWQLIAEETAGARAVARTVERVLGTAGVAVAGTGGMALVDTAGRLRIFWLDAGAMEDPGQASGLEIRLAARVARPEVGGPVGWPTAVVAVVEVEASARRARVVFRRPDVATGGAAPWRCERTAQGLRLGGGGPDALRVELAGFEIDEGGAAS